jgi:hypothetical protein
VTDPLSRGGVTRRARSEGEPLAVNPLTPTAAHNVHRSAGLAAHPITLELSPTSHTAIPADLPASSRGRHTERRGPLAAVFPGRHSRVARARSIAPAELDPTDAMLLHIVPVTAIPKPGGSHRRDESRRHKAIGRSDPLRVDGRPGSQSLSSAGRAQPAEQTHPPFKSLSSRSDVGGTTATLSDPTTSSPALAPGASLKPSRLTPPIAGGRPLTGLPAGREAGSLPAALPEAGSAARIDGPFSAPATPDAGEGRAAPDADTASTLPTPGQVGQGGGAPEVGVTDTAVHAGLARLAAAVLTFPPERPRDFPQPPLDRPRRAAVIRRATPRGGASEQSKSDSSAKRAKPKHSWGRGRATGESLDSGTSSHTVSRSAGLAPRFATIDPSPTLHGPHPADLPATPSFFYPPLKSFAALHVASPATDSHTRVGLDEKSTQRPLGSAADRPAGPQPAGVTTQGEPTS